MKKFFTSIWNEVSFLYTELKKSFSDEQSYFSSKRIERMLLFTTALVASNVWFWHKYPDLDVNEIVFYVVTHLGYAGYLVTKTESAKKNKSITKEDESDESKNG